MKEYLLKITGMAILTTIFSILSPEKKLKKPIDAVLKLCMLTMLLSPVFLFFGQNKELFSSETTISADEDYLSFSTEKAVRAYAQEEYGVTVRVEFSGKVLNVYILDFGMIEKSEHINIQNELSGGLEKLYADKEVRVYDQSD